MTPRSSSLFSIAIHFLLISLSSSYSLSPISLFRGLKGRFHPPSHFTPHVASVSPDITGKAEKAEKGEKEGTSGTFNWEQQWWPMCVEDFTDKNKPHPQQLLGKDIVLWYDAKSQKWSALEDHCPHRGVPLSEGRVEPNGQLLCSYHAWTFDSTGKCTNIPQTENADKQAQLLDNPKSSCKSFPIQVKQGLIWIWGESGLPGSDAHIRAALKEPRLIEELYDPSYQSKLAPYTWNFRDLPYGYDFFMENTLDPAHVVVSHHNIVGNRYTDATSINLTRVPSGDIRPAFPEDEGFNFMVQGPKSPQNSKSFNDFRPPCLNKISTVYDDGAKLILALYATPTKPGYCRHIGAQIFIKNKDNKTPPGLGFFALKMPTFILHPLASLFLHQDQVFLHHQERMLYSTSDYAFGRFQQSPPPPNPPPSHLHNETNAVSLHSHLSPSFASYSKNYFMPNQHDKAISIFRRWIETKAWGGPLWSASVRNAPLPQRLPSEQLFDVYTAHTKNCQVCQTALKNFNKAKVTLAIAAIFCAIVRPFPNPILSFVATGVLSLAGLAIHAFTRLYYKYEFSHQQNN